MPDTEREDGGTETVIDEGDVQSPPGGEVGTVGFPKSGKAQLYKTGEDGVTPDLGDSLANKSPASYKD
jgi:hypothetical protein